MSPCHGANRFLSCQTSLHPWQSYRTQHILWQLLLSLNQAEMCKSHSHSSSFSWLYTFSKLFFLLHFQTFEMGDFWSQSKTGHLDNISRFFFFSMQSETMELSSPCEHMWVKHVHWLEKTHLTRTMLISWFQVVKVIFHNFLVQG